MFFISCSTTNSIEKVYEVEKINIAPMPTEYIFNVSKDSMYKILESSFYPTDVIERIKKTWGLNSREKLDNINPNDYYFTVKDEFEYSLLGIDSSDFMGEKPYLVHFPVDFFKDEYLDAWIRYPTGISYNYKFKGIDIHPIYKTLFYIKLDEVNIENTRVSIFAYQPKIVIGSEVRFDIHHDYQRFAIEIPAEPSTIEEYQILLRIGEAIGVKDQMPKLVLPEY